jgi:tRNA(His) guanylyltransferase|tara:strand:- start:7701 stop:8588 length:888 start_codon:yes stop_codon:yes gene_type:complete
MKGKVKYGALSTRMKEYEAVTKYKLLRRGYTMIRIDGKAFHTYTKGLIRPFDYGLVEDMDDTAKYLCKNIQGAVCAFVQSDEISILVTDFEKIETSAWLDNTIQKMCSISASMATAAFNKDRISRLISSGKILLEFDNLKWAEFDSRVYQLPTKGEVINYLVWRQQDTVKNSISSVAQSMFSHKELNGKNGNEKQEMMFQKDGTNWNDFDPKLKRGRMIVKETYEKEPDVFRTRWVSVAPPTFTQEKGYLDNLIPDREFGTVPHINFIPKDLTEDEKQSLIKALKSKLTSLIIDG